MLRVDGLDVARGERALLRGLRLQVRRGERWALLGRNGAGKSTLLRTFAGLEAVPARVVLGGVALDRLGARELAARRAYMPAQALDRFGIAVLHAVMLAQPQPDEAAALDCLARVDAAALAPRALLRLSAGERQRVALAQALAQRAPLLLLDEPASFQDPAHQRALERLLRGLSEHALVFAAHDVNWVGGLATHALGLLGNGDWVAGPIDEVLREPVLRELYGCAWERIARADGAALWLPA
jgi:iron complex transport system ATP-binding protein